VIVFARQRPALFVSELFLAVVLFYTSLLSLPFATASGKSASFGVAFFTTTSAISGTGLIVEPTGIFWSDFGKVVIMLTMQTGGLGVMTLASLLGIFVSKQLGLTTRILTASDIKESRFGEIGALLRVVVITTFTIEAVVAVMLVPRFMEMHLNLPRALWHSVFFAVSAFNNAGFDLSESNFITWGSHWGVVIPMAIGMTMGAIGFPVIRNLVDVVKHRKLKLLNLNTKLVLTVFFIMDAIILLWFFAIERDNAGLFPPEVIDNTSDHFAGLTFGALTTRASGFGVLNAANLTQPTLLLAQIWMFVGAGPASTCAGIKVTTVAVLFIAAWAEFKGRGDLTAYGKRLPPGALKVAVTVLICGVIAIFTFTLIIDQMTEAPLEVVQFDVISAFANCGLSLSLAPLLNDVGLTMMGMLMFIGRLGTMTVAAALMKRDRSDLVRYPEENLIIG
jgi:Trk-type K+ transport system membrane component